TIYRLIWFLEQKPGLVDKSRMFLFMPSIFNYFLTGTMANDITMAGTSMLTSAGERRFSEKILSSIGFPADRFGPPAEPGSIVGKVTTAAARATGLPEGIPVAASGHDTQFAIFGSGAGKDEPVLSSGTWEILMVRSSKFRSGRKQLEMGITTEFDSRPGLYNIGNQWIASGITEWARKILYPDIEGDVFGHMISAAEKVPPGSNGITVSPGFLEETGGRRGGEIRGLTLNSTRDEIYRAMLEALSLRLSEAKNALEEAGGFSAESILCVGGGSKNRLWNQLRADYTGVPVRVIDHKETTVLGASLFAQAACGNAGSPEEARASVSYRTETFYPSVKSNRL
ncbi:MAG: FGGY-family carbohydrate kinase, partial [Bacteroidales bacterium]|nr:FGGY-family carbohydrate kinase [Bacteroidales bacterium]